MERDPKLFVVGALALIVGLAGGYFIGDARGGAVAERQYGPLLDLAYPRPADVLHTLSGTVQEIYGASFTLEVINPDDYLPHADGSPRAKEMRTANVSAATEYTLLDFTATDREGNPRRTSLAFSDLKPGDTVMVRSGENIRDASSFEATMVERIRK